MRTLHAIALVQRDCRDLVKDFVLTKLVVKHAFPRLVGLEKPTLESMAFKNDREIARLLMQTCAHPIYVSRDHAVTAICNVASKFWHLIDLKRELRGRRRVTLSAGAAKHEFRLRPEDLAMLAKTGKRYAREDVMDASMKRFSSHARLLAYDARVKAAEVKRKETYEFTAENRLRLSKAVGMRLYFENHGSLATSKAEARFFRSGSAADFDAVVELYSSFLV